MTNLFPKLHNAMWPGLVGKGDEEGQEPPISLKRMLELTAAAEVDGQKFEGVDYFLFHPHTDPDSSDEELKEIADLIVTVLKKPGNDKTEKETRDRVHRLTKGFPVPGLGSF